MSLNDIRDQSVPVRLLRRLLARGRVPNGLLFWGPSGVGKGLTAMELAKAVNCTVEQDDACGACLSCRKVHNGNHPDVKLVAPSGRARQIGVDTVDFMNELSAYRPFEGAWRVCVIQDVHRMGIPAQNHFLKTLEEPPSNTIFVLLTDFPRLLLPTIRSRCQQVRFGALRPETVVELLRREHDLEETAAEAIAAVSQGQMSRALDLVHSEKRDAVLHVARELAAGGDPLVLSMEFTAHLRAQQEAIRAAAKAETAGMEMDDASKEGRDSLRKEQEALVEALLRQDLMEYLYLFQTWYRDVMVVQAVGNPEHVLNRDQAEVLRALPPAAGGDGTARLAAIGKAWLYIERNLSVERVFRDLFFALAA